ncbi:unnamed protein product [Sphagnum compactum]
MRLRAKLERALAHMSSSDHRHQQLPAEENWGSGRENAATGYSSLFQARVHDQGASASNIVAGSVAAVVQQGGAASPGSSSAASHVLQQHDQEEDDQAHHHDAKAEALHQPSLEYEEQAAGAGFLGGASELERSADSLSPLPDTREILALGPAADRELVVLLETDQLPTRATAAAGRGSTLVRELQSKEMANEEAGGQHAVEHAVTAVVGKNSKQQQPELERVYRSGVWTLKESIVLLEAKKREREILTGSKRNAVSADEKWRAIAEYCWSQGVQRSKEQCRFKWENTMPDFKKVRDYEEEYNYHEKLGHLGDNIHNKKSYFEMDSWQRKQLNLPPNLNRELYGIMDKLLMQKLGTGTGTKLKESKGKELQLVAHDQLDQTTVSVLEAAVAARPTGEENLNPSEKIQQSSSIPKGNLITNLQVGTQDLGSQGARGEMVMGERSSSGVDQSTTFRVHKDMPMPEVVKGASARKRRKKILPEVTQQEVVGGFGTAAPVELRTSVEIGSASTTPLPSSQAPAGVQWVGLGASHELPPAFKQMGQQQQQQQQQQQGTSEEAGDMTSSPAAKKSKGHKKKMGAAAAPSTEQHDAEIIATTTTTMVAEKSSADYLITTLEEKKEARHREMVTLEREKLAANKEAMNMIAMALNNVANAFFKMADLLQRS